MRLRYVEQLEHSYGNANPGCPQVDMLSCPKAEDMNLNRNLDWGSKLESDSDVEPKLEAEWGLWLTDEVVGAWDGG